MGFGGATPCFAPSSAKSSIRSKRPNEWCLISRWSRLLYTKKLIRSGISRACCAARIPGSKTPCAKCEDGAQILFCALRRRMKRTDAAMRLRSKYSIHSSNLLLSFPVRAARYAPNSNLTNKTGGRWSERLAKPAELKKAVAIRTTLAGSGISVATIPVTVPRIVRMAWAGVLPFRLSANSGRSVTLPTQG